MDMGAVYFKVRFRQLDFKVVNDRAVLVGYDVERQFVQRKARSLVETHLLDVGIEAVLVECLHRNFSTHIADVDMLGVELSRGLFLAIHVIAEITSSDHDGVETEIDILLFLYRILTGREVRLHDGTFVRFLLQSTETHAPKPFEPTIRDRRFRQ